MIRTIIVDDSLSARKWIYQLLEQWSEFEVVAEAVNGKQAVEKTKELTPDLVIMDISMPVMNGVSATREIMTYCPTPIVVVSGIKSSEVGASGVEVLRAGALEFVEKPDETAQMSEWEYRFHHTLCIAARVKVIRQRRVIPQAKTVLEPRSTKVSLIAIGASTGGPQVIARILEALPPLEIPTIIALHIPASATEHILKWYNSISSMPVVGAEQNMHLDTIRGTVCLAVPDQHLVLSNNCLKLINTAPVHHCKPSVDVLFTSIAQSKNVNTLAILLSGMGEDGAQGLLDIRNTGGRTIAQDEKTSTVFGMPKAAIEKGGAEQVLSDSEIAPRIIELVTSHGGH